MKPTALDLDNLPMVSFTCEAHGPYTSPKIRDDMSHWCPVCSSIAQGMTDAARQRYREDTNRHDLFLGAGIPYRYLNRTLDNWTPGNERQRKVAGIVQRWADDIPARMTSGMGLLFLGPPGVGKSHLLAALVAEACKAGHAAVYAVWGDALERTKATFSASREHPDRDLLERLAWAPVLALDELGGPASEYDARMLFSLIDTRYREGLPLLLATNLTTATLRTLGERTADRLREMMVMVPIDGQSRRGQVDIPATAPLAVPAPTAAVVTVNATVNGELRAIKRAVDL